MTFALTACVDLTPVQGHALSTTAEQRFTDEAINRDLAVFQDMRARIARVYPLAVSVYAIARADAMTEFSAKEYGENDKTGVLEAALDDALRLLISQEQGKADIKLDPPAFPGVAKIRPDLWAKVETVKRNPKLMQCAGETAARLEVGLLELGHEQYEVDAKLNTAEHTLPAAAKVNALLAKLDAALAACPQALPIDRYRLPREKIRTQSLGDEQAVKYCPEIKNSEQRKGCLQAKARGD